MAADDTRELNYDLVVHQVLDRLEQLQSLSDRVATAHGQAERALALLSEVAPPLRALVDDSATTAREVDDWRSRSTVELRGAIAEIAVRMEDAIRSANDAASAELARVASVIERDLGATRSEMATTRDAYDEASRNAERRSQEILNATTRTSSDVGSRVGELSVKLEVANQAQAQAISRMNGDAHQTRRELTANLGALLGGVNTLAQETATLRRTVRRLVIGAGVLAGALLVIGVLFLMRGTAP